MGIQTTKYTFQIPISLFSIYISKLAHFGAGTSGWERKGKTELNLVILDSFNYKFEIMSLRN